MVLNKVGQVVIKKIGEKYLLIRNYLFATAQGCVYQLVNVFQRRDMLTIIKSLHMLEKLLYPNLLILLFQLFFLGSSTSGLLGWVVEVAQLPAQLSLLQNFLASSPWSAT